MRSVYEAVPHTSLSALDYTDRIYNTSRKSDVYKKKKTKKKTRPAHLATTPSERGEYTN